MGVWGKIKNQMNDYLFFVDTAKGEDHKIIKVYAKDSGAARKKVESYLENGWKVESINAV